MTTLTRNKMNPHNLAICFAPVLMLDTSDYLDLQVNLLERDNPNMKSTRVVMESK